MIRAAKNLDLDICVLRAASVILNRLRKDRVCGYTELQKCLRVLGKDSDVVFLPSIHFLYLLGKVQYHPQTDSFEYIELEVKP